MNLKEYIDKSRNLRTKHLKFPSGLEFDIVIPLYSKILENAKSEKNIDLNNPAHLISLILKEIEKQFPKEGGVKLTLDDLLPDDFNYLVGEINNFFTSITIQENLSDS